MNSLALDLTKLQIKHIFSARMLSRAMVTDDLSIILIRLRLANKVNFAEAGPNENHSTALIAGKGIIDKDNRTRLDGSII